MLGARVTGHIAAIFPGDNALVHAGDVIMKIDDGDYRIAVDGARPRIATQEPPSRVSGGRSRRSKVRSSRPRPTSFPRKRAEARRSRL